MVEEIQVLKNGKRGSRPGSPVGLLSTAASSNGGGPQNSESSEDEREGRYSIPIYITRALL